MDSDLFAERLAQVRFLCRQACTALADLQGLLPYLEDRQDLIEENAYLRGLSCIESNDGQSIEDWLNNQ